ncbi:MAG: glutamate synthase subunit beta [Myxococcota bacterium]
MGKVTGFMEVGRKTPTKRPPSERVEDYLEIYAEPGDELIRAQGGRCMDCGVPFCNNGCPLGNIIPDWNDLVYRGRFREALERLHRTNNFPEFTGRICPAPCESACVLGINDDPVTIEIIEKTIAERGFTEGWVVPEPPERRSGKRVAIIGSGPAGLAAAQQLNRAGHHVTLYEKKDRVGGLLRYGIPDFKLEKWTVDRRVEIMVAEGVELRTGVHVGRDVTGSDLLREFDAVLLTGGAEAPRDLPVPGRDLDGIHFAMDFLEQQNRRVAGDAVSNERAILATGKNVLVLGGGDTGSDCIGTSHRQGAKHVYNFELLERPPETRPDEAPWPLHPMPSQILRTSSSHEEGGSRDWGISTTRFTGSNGSVEKLHAVRVRFGPPDPASGRRDLVPVPGSEFTIDVDLVLLAMGFLGPVPDGIVKQLGVSLTERGNIATNGYAASVPKVYAAGDMRRGQSLVVWAIAEGRQAAEQIDRDLRASSG